MKFFKIPLLFSIIVILVSSCNKHVVEYGSNPVPPGSAEFQFHYFVPLTTGAANNIYKVEINDKIVSDSSSPVSTYNAIPSGAVGRFFTVNSGPSNMKLYKGGDALVYDQDFTLLEGKQNVFVYDFNKPPVVFDNQFPYPKNTTADTDSTSWVRFYNFLFEKDDITTNLKLQYQYRIINNGDTTWVNIGQPVAFGEATGWEPVKVIKSIPISSGYQTIYYRIRVIGENGEDQGTLKVRNSSGSMVDYLDYWTTYIGRAVHHIFGGMREATPISSVRLFYAR